MNFVKKSPKTKEIHLKVDGVCCSGSVYKTAHIKLTKRAPLTNVCRPNGFGHIELLNSEDLNIITIDEHLHILRNQYEFFKVV